MFFVFISSCESDGETKITEVNKEYTINLPNFLSKTDTISEVAIPLLTKHKTLVSNYSIPSTYFYPKMIFLLRNYLN